MIRISSARCLRVLSVGVAFYLQMIADVQAANPVILRVMTYNIHHGEGIDGKIDLERIARTIKSARPDLVALQEVDKNVTRTGNVDQPAELAKLTQMHVAFGANIELQGGHYGNAVLSRFPILRHENHLLPNINNGEQRGVIEVRTKLPHHSSCLLFWGTHLDHRRAPAERIESAKAINRLIKGSSDPALLAGDFNDTIGSQTLRLIESRWKRTNNDPALTIPVTRPNRQIDFIFCRPSKFWKVLEFRVLEESVASDHRPVLTVLKLTHDAE